MTTLNRYKCGISSAIITMLALIFLGFPLMTAAQERADQQSENEYEGALEEVLVTGIRRSILDSLDTKREADSFLDSITAEDIGKFPDQNIAESLQRVSGVTIDRRSGEGQEITVRGLGPDFNRVLMNNRQIATITGGRNFDFQVIASELIGAVDVYKTATANLTEGWMGGLVNMRTMKPLDNPGQRVAGTLMGRYQDLGEEWGPVASGIYIYVVEAPGFGQKIGKMAIFTETEILNQY